MPSEGKTAVPRLILDLVDRFDRNREAYKSGAYNETQVRREFLDPFFKALGWDIDNEQGYAEAYKDVIHEDAIKIGDGTRAPDYCFRIGGARKFFLEAKRPSIDIKNDASPAFQLRRYAWTSKLPLSILTDFEEFAVYDCRVKPDQKDKASVARVLYIPLLNMQRAGTKSPVFSPATLSSKAHSINTPKRTRPSVAPPPWMMRFSRPLNHGARPSRKISHYATKS
jgi:hypothetical protein